MMKRLVLVVALVFLSGMIGKNWAQEKDDSEQQIQDLQQLVNTFKAGTHRFMLAGYASNTFIKEENQPSTIETGFSPIFLYRATDKILFEGEVEFELEDGVQIINFEYGQMLFLLNDYLTFGAGKFLNPASYFLERLHPAWINKLPDMPFFAKDEGGIQATGHLGFQLRGAAPLGSSKIEYAAFVGNGPVLNPDEGIVEFENFGDNNSNKVFGGRLGIFPLPQMEIGYGLEVGKTGDRGSVYRNVKAINNTVDFSLTQDVSGLKGGIDVRAQATWLTIDNPNIAPLTFDNTSVGGYGQIAYRPSNANSDFVKKLEFVYRYDWLNRPDNAPNNLENKRSSFGLNYWFSSSAVFKVAFETNKTTAPSGTSDTVNRFLAQVGLGF